MGICFSREILFQPLLLELDKTGWYTLPPPAAVVVLMCFLYTLEIQSHSQNKVSAAVVSQSLHSVLRTYFLFKRVTPGKGISGLVPTNYSVRPCS